MFNFEKLEVWQKSIAFGALVYRATRSFTSTEQFGLSSQIPRAATSVSSNIAEGSARPRQDFARFLDYAAGSVFEVISQATVARNEGFLTDIGYRELYSAGEEISRMLSGLRSSLGE